MTRWDRLTAHLVEAGTMVKLDDKKKPNSFLALSDPADVARVESRTYICSATEDLAGPPTTGSIPTRCGPP